MSRWERFHGLHTKEIRIDVDLPEDVKALLQINTETTRKLLRLGGFNFLRISTESLAPTDNNIKNNFSRYEIGGKVDSVAIFSAQWHSLEIIFNFHCIQKYVDSSQGNQEQLFTKILNDELKKQIIAANWERNLPHIISSSTFIDVVSLTFIFQLYYVPLLKEADPNLANYLTAIVCTLLVHGLAWHGYDHHVVNPADAPEKVQSEVKFSLFRSVPIDRALLLLALASNSKVIRAEKP